MKSSENRRLEKAVAQASALMERLGWDPPHARQVAKLALRLFDQLAPLHGLGARERTLLHAAALLHDVGWTVRRARHHKHSARLIRANRAKLAALSSPEVERVALVARYHRKAEPSERHRAFEALPVPQRSVVGRLAALLRLADVLDRDHRQAVEGLQCEWNRGTVRIRLQGRLMLFPDASVLARKSRLFTRFYGMPVELEKDVQ